MGGPLSLRVTLGEQSGNIDSFIAPTFDSRETTIIWTTVIDCQRTKYYTDILNFSSWIELHTKEGEESKRVT